MSLSTIIPNKKSSCGLIYLFHLYNLLYIIKDDMAISCENGFNSGSETDCDTLTKGNENDVVFFFSFSLF